MVKVCRLKRARMFMILLTQQDVYDAESAESTQRCTEGTDQIGSPC